MTKIISRRGTTCFSTDFERIHELFERSNTFDCIRNEPIRTTQSAGDLTRVDLSSVSLVSRSFAFLWRRPAESQAAQDKPIQGAGIGECSSVEDIKRRWRCQQIAIQQKNAAPEKASIWSVLSRNRGWQSSTTRDRLRSKSTPVWRNMFECK